MKIVILGPVSPSALSSHLDPSDAAIAQMDDGVHGPSIGALAAKLVELGHQLMVVTHRRGHGPLQLKGPNVVFHRVDSRASAKKQILDGFRYERRQMHRLLRGVEADLIHAQWTYEWALVSLLVDLPRVVTIHDAPLTVIRQNRSLYWIMRYAMAWRFRLLAKNVSMLAVSPYVAHRWSKELLWKREIPVIPNSVAVPKVTDRKPSRSSTHFVEVANASSLKNVRRLILAFDIVRRQRSDVRLLLIGAGLGPADELSLWAQQHGLAPCITFLGSLSQLDVLQHLNDSDIHIHASLEESFGLTLVESMQLGVPVIAGIDSGATAWVLDGGRCGLLADMRDVQSIAEAMISALDNSESHSSRAEAGRLHFQEKFSVDAVARAHVRHYENLLSASEASASDTSDSF